MRRRLASFERQRPEAVARRSAKRAIRATKRFSSVCDRS